MNPSGLRIGTPALTTRGLVEDDLREIAEVICVALSDRFEAERASFASAPRADERYPLYPQLARRTRSSAAPPAALRLRTCASGSTAPPRPTRWCSGRSSSASRAAGHEVEVTAREYGQTRGSSTGWGSRTRPSAPRRRVDSSKAAGPRPAQRVAGPLGAAAPLRAGARPRLGRPGGGLDRLRIPSVQMQDYEYAGLQRQLAFRAARRVLVPDAIPVEAHAAGPEPRSASCSATRASRRTTTWPASSPTALSSASSAWTPTRVLAVVRPPPETSAYHAPNSLYEASSRPARRNARGPDRADPAHPGAGESVLGPGRRTPSSCRTGRSTRSSLIAFADAVVSAGGTMNREAVALGTPVWTIFSGEMGAVDERLIADRRPAAC